MSYDDARSQFPVLAHIAYLNAGTNGPLAQSTLDAIVDATERDARDGRGGKAYIERMLELRLDARRGFAEVLDVDPEHVALVESTTRGCEIGRASCRERV